MKKKHLRSLNTVQKWLKTEVPGNTAVDEAFMVIRTALDSLPDEVESDGELPAPLEISEEPQTLALYSDGGCRGNPGPGAFAFVVQTHAGEILTEGADYDSMTTNNKMELSGPLKGLEELLQILPEKSRDPLLTKVKVMTDSKYVVDGMKTWVTGWKSRGWKKADKQEPENLDLWKALDQIREKFMVVEWMWVKGHAGHPQNEYCDKKANEVLDAHKA
jgi:ribonuclease HI